MKILMILLAIFVVSCSSKKENKTEEVKPAFVIAEPEKKPDLSDQLLTLDEANTRAEEYLKKIEDADKKLNQAGKVLALSYWEKNNLSFKKAKRDSSKVKNMISEVDLKSHEKEEEYTFSEFSNKAKTSKLRLLFSYNKKRGNCSLYSQFIATDNSVEESVDKYPMTVSVNFCIKAFGSKK